MIFAVVFDRVFFHTMPTLLSLLGMIIITASAVYVAVRSIRSTVVVFPMIAHYQHNVISKGSLLCKDQRTTPTAMTMHAKRAMMVPIRALLSKSAYVRKIMMTAEEK